MSSAREAQGRKKLFVQDIELLRRTAQTGTGVVASAARHFSYVLRYLDESDIPAIVELHGTIVGSLPNRLLLYRRDRPFFTACIERGCVAVAFDGDRAIGYAASSIPATDEENYGTDLGLGPDQLTHVAHLSGSAVLPDYRGKRNPGTPPSHAGGLHAQRRLPSPMRRSIAAERHQHPESPGCRLLSEGLSDRRFSL